MRHGLIWLALAALSVAAVAVPRPTYSRGRAMMRPRAQVMPHYQTQVVVVSLTEYQITVDPAEVSPGTVTLAVSNDGTKTHALAIEGSDLRTPELGPGQATTLTLTAEPGKTYTLYCPINQHRMLGMEVRLPVR